jgi:hypothetical protein
MAKRAVFLAILGSILADAQTVHDNPPRFEDYPVTDSWHGSVAQLKLITPSERMFRTRLSKAAKQPPVLRDIISFRFWDADLHVWRAQLSTLRLAGSFRRPWAEREPGGIGG